MSPVECWRRGDPPPVALLDAVRNGSVVCAHNAMFELAVWTYVCAPRMGWPTLSPYQMDCTMARAHVMSLLGGLEQATKLLRLPVTKNPHGRRLIHLFSVPRRPAKNEPAYDAVRWNEPEDHAADFNEFVAYCADDVRAEGGLDKALPKLSDREREIFHFDLVVNLRGFAMDTAMLRKAAAFVDEAKARLDQEISDLTEGAVTSTTQTERIKAWLAARGVHVTSIGKGEAENIIAQTRVLGDDTAERVFELRRLGAKKTSLQKFNRALECIGFDGRARGLLTYHKAGTGRWAGAIYQPHNLQRFDYDNDWPLIEHMLTVLHDEGSARVAVDWCAFLGHQPMQLIGKMQRAMIVAPEGREFIGADYSNVEGRGSAWNADETWKVQAFIDYDRGVGPDLYKLAYSRSFGVPIDDVTKAGRQIGKVQELALGYQGAVGAYISMSANYGIKPQDILAAVKPIATPEGWDAAAAKYARSAKHGLDEDTWTALRYVVDGWRGGHPRTVQAWWDIQDLVVGAVSEPGVMHYMLNNRVRAYCARNMSFLYIFLPSGRPLSYFRPRIKTTTEEDPRGGTRKRRSVVVEGWDSRINAWGDIHLYGGLEWENVTQGLCRDLLAAGLMRCERAGYPVVLHVHDEGVFEVPFGQGKVEEVQRLMAMTDPWAKGFPLTTAAWRDRRYVK